MRGIKVGDWGLEGRNMGKASTMGGPEVDQKERDRGPQELSEI